MPPAFRFQVSPSSGVPIYRQLIDQVRHQVAADRLKPGEFLPSVRQTAGELQVNPMTVSKAYSLLERDGVVEMVRGQGVRIRPAVQSPDDLGTVRQRKENVRRLLEQAVVTAYQSAIAPEQVRKMLDTLLEEVHDDAPRK